MFFLLNILLKNTSRLVSDDSDKLLLNQADCPRVIDIFTTEIVSDSIQFHAINWLEEFPASSEVFISIPNTNKMIEKNSISHTVQPVPGPFSTRALSKSNNNDGGSNQNDTLFNRGKAISGAPQ